jgi:hypothetical protein
MTMTRSVRAGLAAGLLAATGWAVLGGASPAVADTPSVSLDLQCTYPLIGPRALSVAISTNLPATVEAGTATAPIQVDAVATISADTTPGLVMVGSKTLGGGATASVRITGPGTDLPLQVPTTLESTPVPATGAFDTVAHATIDPLTFAEAGTYRVTLDDLLLSITPRDAAGRTTGLDSFDSDCTLEPGQDTVVATIEVTDDGGPTDPPTDPPTEHRTYGVTGSSYLATPKATMALRGTFDATYDASGPVSADVAFEPTTATVRMFTFFPATARIQLVPTARTTGTLASGVLSTTTEVDVRVPSVTFFGFPIASSRDCHTGAPAVVALRSGGGWDATKGGVLTGRYTLPAFQQCGAMTDALSHALAGPDNTVKITLAPQG